MCNWQKAETQMTSSAASCIVFSPSHLFRRFHFLWEKNHLILYEKKKEKINNNNNNGLLLAWLPIVTGMETIFVNFTENEEIKKKISICPPAS